MDRFLQNQESGEVVDSENAFTVDRSRSRDKLLESIPEAELGSVYRLLDASVRQLGEHPTTTIKFNGGSRNRASRIQLDLPHLEAATVNRFLDELRRPFGEGSGASTLARAVFVATKVFSSIDCTLGRGFFRELSSDLALSAARLDVPNDLAAKEAGLTIEFLPAGRSEFREHRRSIHSRIDEMLRRPQRILPLESFSDKVSGYFDYRTKPFTAIRSYFCGGSCASERAMLLDLWDGPYDYLDENTAILKKRERGKFLFLTWRPNYGTPTFLHHFLNVPVKAALHRVTATFWVESTDRPAQVHFFSRNMISDSVPIKGPPGLSGLVIWSDLKFDLWGTRLVEDENCRQAVMWAQSRADETFRCLSENLPDVIDRLRASNVLKKAYIDETIRKIEGFWGKA